jgi:hypothetical protein
MIFQFAFLLLILSLVSAIDDYYTKFIHNYDPEAICLDGSPSFLYVHQGGIPDHILIYFFGGGSCGAKDLSSTV